MTRTQEEIIARVNAIGHQEDWLGFRRQVLIEALDFEHAKPYIKDSVTADDWTVDDDIERFARDYLPFAVEKIRRHKGISAGRSVDKLGEFAWLLGRDDLVVAMDEADYPQYGAPKVKAFADGMGWPWPDSPDLARMADGLPCENDCVWGCDS